MSNVNFDPSGSVGQDSLFVPGNVSWLYNVLDLTGTSVPFEEYMEAHPELRGKIYKVAFVTGTSDGSMDHSNLINRDIANQHPGTSISIDTTGVNFTATTVQALIGQINDQFIDVANEMATKMTLPDSVTAGNIAVFTADGEVMDGGKSIAELGAEMLTEAEFQVLASGSALIPGKTYFLTDTSQFFIAQTVDDYIDLTHNWQTEINAAEEAANTYTDEQIASHQLANQIWLPAVQLATDLPTPPEPEITNYLCRVIGDTSANNGVYQWIAGATSWTWFGDNSDFIDQQELDDALAGVLALTGGTMSGNIAMGGNKVTGLALPTATNDAVSKTYVDTAVQTLTTSVAGKLDTYGMANATSRLTGNHIFNGIISIGNNFYIDGDTWSINNAGYIAGQGVSINLPSGEIAGEGGLSIYNNGNTIGIYDSISMVGNNIYSVADPLNSTDAANKSYVDSRGYRHNISISGTPSNTNNFYFTFAVFSTISTPANSYATAQAVFNNAVNGGTGNTARTMCNGMFVSGTTPYVINGIEVSSGNLRVLGTAQSGSYVTTNVLQLSSQMTLSVFDFVEPLSKG